MDKTTGSINPEPSAQVILRAFARALELARAHEGATAPNPPVGCILLDAEGRELTAGAHRRAGQPHAEAEAIALARAAGLADRIDTVLVTLEPCNHHGRTPPCAEAILTTGARRVWIACRDSNPGVAGGGAERLRAAGLSVNFLSDLDHPSAAAVLAEAERLVAPFSRRVQTGLPFVTVKQAISTSGSMVPPNGQKTFTNASSLELAHRLRRRADAILTGSGTVLADDPQFTVRLVPDHPDKQRMLVLLDRRRRIPEPWLAAARTRGFAVYLADDVHEALQTIGAAAGMEVLVEAGPTLTTHMLSAGLWDEHVLIEQAANTDGTDRVTLRRNPAPQFHLQGKDRDVLGHH
ncbi:bifunctional diaminohydroxyphosphoribosylaminopyrimidine deaminase/5-amino-6-(5-phosphoribosylamino)uracil reductase RibD [Devosia sp. ZB163]|uniref:bifunctional diaminohydroxyphosphoribosylaminopyrimidine deaminase/5-amino-6-(5-phosphoribosylamino)uracil reductase RibD n=1 Tax=Devosia sp. ZB163 TaxID=3025938 RepID=UPI002361AEEF|nr:bifunctional diaminohydroxyphosphoribosylaminopyrimidine deaminase/5-amino-6-(5-phosphoribosylamino)uracil reductase RibD [Devosia sp. ZB163]MDC9825365.1 bifunctional diaminohydroxyphosphoribosylaminopyrimidine deaminase/5-amino-6-(5-phosphoribosylamino)uracil reductase RibD [Devosia sp. ZB163]